MALCHPALQESWNSCLKVNHKFTDKYTVAYLSTVWHTERQGLQDVRDGLRHRRRNARGPWVG